MTTIRVLFDTAVPPDRVLYAARDFTANAIAQPVAGGDYVDPLGGRRDVESRTLRTVSVTFQTDDQPSSVG